MWLKKHVGVLGNETVAKLAKTAATTLLEHFQDSGKKEYFKNDREITKLVHLLGDEDIVNFSLKYSEILRFTNSSQIVKRSNILQIYSQNWSYMQFKTSL